MFSVALAAGEAAPQGSILSFVPLIVLVAVFYFFIIRPQQKRAKTEQKMRNELRIGDKVVLSSGIFGSVMEIDDVKKVISVEVSKGVNITVHKASIAEVLTLKSSEAKDDKSAVVKK